MFVINNKLTTIKFLNLMVKVLFNLILSISGSEYITVIELSQLYKVFIKTNDFRDKNLTIKNENFQFYFRC